MSGLTMNWDHFKENNNLTGEAKRRRRLKKNQHSRKAQKKRHQREIALQKANRHRLVIAVKRGYLLNQDGSEVLHREIYQNEVGQIPAGWVVHHCDGKKTHNVLENLLAMPEEFHLRLHNKYRLYQLPNKAATKAIMERWLTTRLF